jgi:hypothetical protein
MTVLNLTGTSSLTLMETNSDIMGLDDAGGFQDARGHCFAVYQSAFRIYGGILCGGGLSYL